MLWPVKIFRSKKSKNYFLLGIVNDIPKSNSEPAVTITCVINENMSFEKKVVNFEIKQNMD